MAAPSNDVELNLMQRHTHTHTSSPTPASNPSSSAPHDEEANTHTYTRTHTHTQHSSDANPDGNGPPNPRARGLKFSSSASGLEAMLPCSLLRRVGNNYVLLQGRDGRLIITFGPHWPGVLVTIALLMVTTVFFINTWLTKFPFVCKFIAITMFTSSMVFLMLTACADPGIVRVTPVLSDDTDDPAPFCDICEIHQPPRTAHCDDCNCCIERLDHHCPWMGKCIGKGNMLWFKLFNLSWISYLVYFCTIAVILRM